MWCSWVKCKTSITTQAELGSGLGLDGSSISRFYQTNRALPEGGQKMARKRKIYYKVVFKERCFDGSVKYVSVFTDDPQLNYEIGEYTSTVKPLADIGFHPTIFKNKKSATNFACQLQFGYICECHVWGLIKKPPLRFTCGPSPLTFVQEYGRNTGIPFKLSMAGDPWPAGTMMAKKVKLLREI